ncbi:MAG: hypothetical protein M1825_005359 [Sarcosagium campestre]|nr:MAG: hypothetical protein M1825_005359 [Sarcosagium campestre]
MSSSGNDEGEINESDSEKAITSLPSNNGTTVDRPSRDHGQARLPTDEPRQAASFRDRSPHRTVPRSEKRSRDESDLQYDSTRSDPRHFKVRYEGRSHDDRSRRRNQRADLDQHSSMNPSRYDRRGGRDRYYGQRHRTRSRSPVRSARGREYNGWGGRSERDRPRDYDTRAVQDDYSDRVSSFPASSRSSKRSKISNPNIKDGESSRSDGHLEVSDTEERPREADTVENVAASEPIDEASLIEARRKRREAIKAKYVGQGTPLLAQALQQQAQISEATSPSRQDSGRSPIADAVSSAYHQKIATPQLSPPQSPKDESGVASPSAFAVLKDEDLANGTAGAELGTVQDGPSAADYDPTVDMREDRIRDDQRHREDEVNSGAYDETKASDQAVLLPLATEQTARKPKTKPDDFDMFADEDEEDMFADETVGTHSKRKDERESQVVSVPQPKQLDMSMLDNWDDHEGYYRIILGELLEGRYHVQANLGKGMFSGVVRALDTKEKKLVAIKLIRNNDTMRRAGMKEIEILQTLNEADLEDKKHVIRLERSFDHKGHLCMVFENLSINLREVLKKFGRDVGINLRAVRAYAQQMFLGLSLLKKCNILHADVKPDNVLVNESRNMLKICDLGSASDASENEITPYLVSRFYRAPEIILGMPYDFAIDTWSVGCTLYELYTGKILFTGRTNNQMLRAIMECRGKFSAKMLRRAQFASMHFDSTLDFHSVETDKLTGKPVTRTLSIQKPTRDLKSRLMPTAKGSTDAELKELNLFADLLDRCLNLNPEKRCTPLEALRHPFISRPRA